MIDFGIMMGVFISAIILGVPIAFAIGTAVIAILLINDVPIVFAAQTAFSGLDNYSYLAIPMFILAGSLMEKGGLSIRLVNLASTLVGRMYGGLGVVTVLACMFFAAISGSSPATVAAIGSIMIPAMKKEGYDVNFAGALTASAGSLGVMIPPSVTMIIYAIVAQVSVGKLFLAGFIPGIIIGISLIVLVIIVSRKKGFRSQNIKDFSLIEFKEALKDSLWALLTPVIILGGIYQGIFTPTESAVIAVVYSLFVGFFIYKELKIQDIPEIFVSAAITTAKVVVILGFALAFARFLTVYRIPQMLAVGMEGISDNRILVYLLFILLTFICGTFMAIEAIILIFTPIFLPILIPLGVDPIHFGIVFVLAGQLGFLTPPVGVNLFVAQGITNTTLLELSKSIVPFLIVMLFVQIFFVLFPDVIMFLPNLFYK